MKTKPILFSGAMVRAILEGKKTQTRRIMKVQPDCLGALENSPGGELVYHWPHSNTQIYYCKCPYGQPGDGLWVRETWRTEELSDGLDGIRYKADGFFIPIKNTEEASDAWGAANMNKQLWEKDLWKPSIFMPRWASRIKLEIIGVRVARVQEIDRADAKAEGVSNLWSWDEKRNAKHPEHFRRAVLNPYVANYSVLWDEINAERGFGWDVNPWVWVVEFKRVEVRDVV